MIDKITPDTKVSEICEVLEFMNQQQNTDLFRPCSIEMYADRSGIFRDFQDNEICKTHNLKSYLKIKKPDERDYDKILEDPAAVKKILSKLPIQDILAEIGERAK